MLKSLLNHYETVLLDMDGVITSEQVYWNAAALTVWELLFSKHYFGTEDMDFPAVAEKLADIRKQVFINDAVIRLAKNKGVNNNWDLAWMVTAGALTLSTRDFSAIHRFIETLPTVADGLYAKVADCLQKTDMPASEAIQHGGLWTTVQHIFQEWFLGSALYRKCWDPAATPTDKPGLTFSEEPIINKENLCRLLREIAETKRLGIGSGRPRVEAENPLRSWGVLPYFTPDAIITYNDIVTAQETVAECYQGLSLSKPHPYMFLRGVFGKTYPDSALLAGNFPAAPCQKTLVIGDAACDLFAAKRAGCDFAAVLTGIEGEKARTFFEENGADYILHNILELLES